MEDSSSEREELGKMKKYKERLKQEEIKIT
jgi:hypothetical protein